VIEKDDQETEDFVDGYNEKANLGADNVLNAGGTIHKHKHFECLTNQNELKEVTSFFESKSCTLRN
jgi:hypothetical protein